MIRLDAFQEGFLAVSRRPLYSLWILCVTLCFNLFLILPNSAP
jgi:hypothetical protein